jgi:hypothetical protein
MKYNTETLRELLVAAFNDEDLLLFCADHFKEVRADFTTGQSQKMRIQTLMEYCERRGITDRLVHLVKRSYPNKYAEFEYRLATDVLDEYLAETVEFYLLKSLKDDQFARLDQAGETDADRSTYLRQVFTDLDVKPRSGPQPHLTRKSQLTLFDEAERISKVLHLSDEDQSLSAMECFLQELWPRIVLIGGPGHGKSTLSQYLAQVHRATLLKSEEEGSYTQSSSGKERQQRFVPKTPRIPFRIVLKQFAHWLTRKQRIESVEAYMAEQVGKASSREVSSDNIQKILKARPALVIFDGLDEVMEPALRIQVMERIEEFLERSKVSDCNLQVLATSRPTG